MCIEKHQSTELPGQVKSIKFLSSSKDSFSLLLEKSKGETETSMLDPRGKHQMVASHTPT